MTDKNKPYVPRTARRESSYIKAQARRRELKAKDQRFYNMMFSVAGVMIAVVFGIAFMIMNAGSVDVSGMEGATQPWILGFSKLEWGGFVIVGIFAAWMWRKMKKP